MSVYGAGRYLLETKLATPDTGGKVSEAITSHTLLLKWKLHHLQSFTSMVSLLSKQLIL